MWFMILDLSDVNSVVMDPHKGLFLPFGFGIVLLRSWTPASQEHYLSGCLASLRAYIIWFSVNALGMNTIISNLQEKQLLAKYFYQKLTLCGSVVADYKPQLAIVVFRLKAITKVESNEKSQILRDMLVKKGGFCLNNTWIDGYYYLRACMNHFRLHYSVMQILLEKTLCYVSTQSIMCKKY